jgi:hypothetical protein
MVKTRYLQQREKTMTANALTVDIKTVTADTLLQMQPDELRVMMVRLVNAYNKSKDDAYALEEMRARETGKAMRPVIGYAPYIELRTRFFAKAYGLESDVSHSDYLKEMRDGTHTLTPTAVEKMNLAQPS